MSYVDYPTTKNSVCQDVFSAVKERLSMPQVAEFYGYPPNRAGFICCPFHAEKTPSCKIYPARFHCFGCGVGGTVIDFTARLFDLKPLAAVQKLNADFNLGLSLDRRPLTQEERRKAVEEQQERERIQTAVAKFEDLREIVIRRLNNQYMLAHHALIAGPPWTDAQQTAIRDQAETEYYLNILESDDIAACLDILRGMEVCR